MKKPRCAAASGLMRHKAMATSVLWGTMTPTSLYPIRSRTQAIGNIAKCATEHYFLLVCESTYSTIAIDTIELMIKPRGRLAKIGMGYLSP